MSPTTADGGSWAHPATVNAASATSPVATTLRTAVGPDIVVNVVCGAVTDAVGHPLSGVLARAAAGEFPNVDGAADLLPLDPAGTAAVVSFTGHAFVLTDLTADELADLALDGYGRASGPEALLRIARGGEIGTLDVVLVRRGEGGPCALAERSDLTDHPRVERAHHHRRDVRVLGDERGFVTIGSGLVGRTEMSVELVGAVHGRGAGRGLIAEGLRAVGHDELVFAQVAPGNAASLRAFLASGFVPIGSEVLIEPGPAGVSSDGT